MRVLVNPLASKTGGGTTYLENFLQYIQEKDTGIEFTILLSSVYHRNFIDQDYTRFKKWIVRMPRPAILRIAWEQFVLPILLLRSKYDVIFNLSDFTPIIMRKKDVVLVRNTNIYFDDFSGIQAHSFQRLKTYAQKILANLSILKAKWRIFPSLSMYELVNNSIHGKINRNYSIIHYGVSRDLFNESIIKEGKYRERCERYLLYVSNFAEHKNHKRLIEAFRMVKKRKEKIKLILIGDIPKAKMIKKRLINRLEKRWSVAGRMDSEEGIEFLGHIDKSRLPEFYSRAEIFVFPSIRESFGHPIVEAMSCGVPILISNLSYAHEICGDAAVYFDPFNPKDIADKIIKVLENDGLKADLRRKSIERAKRFSWEKCFEETINVLKRLADE